MKNIISSAAGREKADIVLKNGKIIDVLGHRIVEGNVGIKDGIILGIGDYEGEKEIDVNGDMLLQVLWIVIFILSLQWLHQVNLLAL